jgi:hypothetical protein
MACVQFRNKSGGNTRTEHNRQRLASTGAQTMSQGRPTCKIQRINLCLSGVKHGRPIAEEYCGVVGCGVNKIRSFAAELSEIQARAVPIEGPANDGGIGDAAIRFEIGLWPSERITDHEAI